MRRSAKRQDGFVDFPSIESPPPPLAFFCYARHDDDNESGRVSQLRARIEGEVRAVSGRDFRIWQDTADLRIGSEFDLEIGSVLDSADALVVLVTPSLLTSPYCRREIERFRSRRQREDAPPPIFPILYIDAFGAHNEHDDLAGYLRDIHYADWTELRPENPDSTAYLRSIKKLADDINIVLGVAGASGIGSRIPAAQTGSAASSTQSSPGAAPAGSAASEPLTIDGILQAAAARRSEIVSVLSVGIGERHYGIKNDTLFGLQRSRPTCRSRPAAGPTRRGFPANRSASVSPPRCRETSPPMV